MTSLDIAWFLLRGPHACMGVAAIACAVASQAAPPRFEPKPVEIPLHAPYVLEDGSVTIVGDDVMEPLIVSLNALFVRTHPGIRITPLAKPPPTGIDGIVAGVAAFAAVAHDAWEAELEPLLRQTGRNPVDVHIERRGFSGSGRANPPGVYVNARNPLRTLSIAELARIFTSGQLPGDLRTWAQVGVVGPFEQHVIHVYGRRNDGGFMTSVVDTHFGSHKLSTRYEALPQDKDVLDAVAQDRYGIGMVSFVDARNVPNAVRFLPLGRTDAAPSSATYGEVGRGDYPLSPFLHLYFRGDRMPSLDPFVSEYARLALSPEGQGLVRDLGKGVRAYVPLTASEVDAELQKLK